MYYDFQGKEKKSVEGVLKQIFSVACRRLNLSLNVAYNAEQEGMRDVAKEISSQEPSESDADSLFADCSRMFVATSNDRRFEDDVMLYLILRSVSLIDAPRDDRAYRYGNASEQELARRVSEARHPCDKSAAYAAVGDFLFFSMAAGIAERSPAGKNRAAHAYWKAHGIEECARGRGSACSEVYAKLSLRFPRYYAITEEAFQDSFFQARLKPESLELPRHLAIDALLDELSRLAPENVQERKRIHERLKKLTG